MRLRARQSRLLRKPVLERSNRGTAAAEVIIFILVTALACGRDTPPPTPSSVQSLSPPAALPVASLPAEEKGVPPSTELRTGFDGAQGRPFDLAQDRPAVYQSRGRRDPFRPPRAQKPPMVHLKITGIIRGPHSYYALVEPDASPGMGYVIRENDVVDSAKVVKITKDSVVFEVQTQNSESKLLTRYVEKHMLPVESR